MEKRLQKQLSIDIWALLAFKKKVSGVEADCSKRNCLSVEKLIDLLDAAARKRINFLVIKLTRSKQSDEKRLKDFGFRECGRSLNLSFSCSPTSGNSLNKRVEVRPAKKTDMKALKEIAKDAFRLSYQYRCGFAKKEAIDRYHSQWIENLSKGRNSKVFVCEKDKSIVGFNGVSFDKKKARARIVLIAVKKGCRGLGIGKDLTDDFIEWCGLRFKRVDVRTQSNNKRAISLYQSRGFKIIDSDKTFFKKMR